MAPALLVVETFDTILSLVYLPALFVLLLIGARYTPRAVGLLLSRTPNTLAGQILLEVLVGTLILIASILLAGYLLTASL